MKSDFGLLAFLWNILAGDFGTVIVRGGVDMDKTTNRSSLPIAAEPSPALAGDNSVEQWYYL